MSGDTDKFGVAGKGHYMPSGWLGTGDSDYQAFTPQKGDVLEIRVVDPLLVAIVARQECAGPGEAFTGFCLGASDEYYRYWITEGEGKELREEGQYHLCFKSIEECKTWRGKKDVVHTDRIRMVTPDIREGKIGWVKQRDARAEVVGQLAKFEAKFPPPGVPGDKEGDDVAPEEELSYSEGEEGSSSVSSSEEQELVKKLAKLQEELKTAEKLVADKKGSKAKKKAMKAMKSRELHARGKGRGEPVSSPPAVGEKKKKREKKSEKTDKKDKKGHEKSARNKKRRKDSPDVVSDEKGRKKKKRKEAKAKAESSTSDGDPEESGEALFKSGSRKKEPKEKRREDRGPFGGGPPVSYKDADLSESGSEDESVFREAPTSSTTLSGQQKLTRYSQRYPGRLASRLLLKMKEGAARELVGANNEEGATPPLASHFVLTVLLPQLGPRASLRTQREMMAREFLLDQTVKRYDKSKFPPLPKKGGEKGEKGKGKGKGDKTGLHPPKPGKEAEK